MSTPVFLNPPEIFLTIEDQLLFLRAINTLGDTKELHDSEAFGALIGIVVESSNATTSIYVQEIGYLKQKSSIGLLQSVTEQINRLSLKKSIGLTSSFARRGIGIHAGAVKMTHGDSFNTKQIYICIARCCSPEAKELLDEPTAQVWGEMLGFKPVEDCFALSTRIDPEFRKKALDKLKGVVIPPVWK